MPAKAVKQRLSGIEEANLATTVQIFGIDDEQIAAVETKWCVERHHGWLFLFELHATEAKLRAHVLAGRLDVHFDSGTDGSGKTHVSVKLVFLQKSRSALA